MTVTLRPSLLRRRVAAAGIFNLKIATGLSTSPVGGGDVAHGAELRVEAPRRAESGSSAGRISEVALRLFQCQP